MNLKVKYIPIIVDDPEGIKDFLTGTFGFKFWQKTRLTGDMEGIIVGLDENDKNCMILIKGETKTPARIIINTDDCLKDYDELGRKGLISTEKPQYTPLGLAVDITDSSGNQYMLLEERNYQENL